MDKREYKREYIKANKDWLEAKAKEEGVKALPKGIYYKVLSEGNQDSSKPTARSIITAHYTGKTIDGKQFDSSRGGVPLACTFLPKWAMANSLNRASLVALHLSLKLNC